MTDFGVLPEPEPLSFGQFEGVPPGKRFRHLPMVDVYTEESIRIWMVLVMYKGELSIDRYDPPNIGMEPEWLSRELDMCGWDGMFGFSPWMEWALEHGLAPGQPFLMQIDHPVYHKIWSDWGYDYDVTIDWDIVDRAPIPDALAAKLWTRLLRERNRG